MCYNIYTMKWICLLLVSFLFVETLALTGPTKIMYCIPFKLAAWEREDLLSSTKTCLQDNFVHNIVQLEPWVDAYIAAWRAKEEVEKTDSDLFYVRRERMLTLRDTQFRATHHMHTIQKCSSLANKIPTDISNHQEMHLMIEASDLWNHHLRQDVQHCVRILRQVVHNEQNHMRHHLLDDELHHTIELEKTKEARHRADTLLEEMLVKREEIVSV